MQVTHDLRTWINSGLMTLFFLVVGLEARREFDLGDLRERRRFLLPLVAGLAGMAVPALIFLAVNAGHSSAHGWARRDVDRHRTLARPAGVARPRRPGPGPRLPADRLRRRRPGGPGRPRCGVHRRPRARRHLVVGVAAFAVLLVGIGATGETTGTSMSGSGSPCGRRCSPAESTRLSLVWPSGCRHRRTPRPASSSSRRHCWSRRSASSRPRYSRVRPAPSITSTLSPNERLQTFFHPWTSYLIVPLFALANAGIELNGELPAPRPTRTRSRSASLHRLCASANRSRWC